MIGEAAQQAGARITATGDTGQLGAVEAGGMFRLLAARSPPRSCTRSAGSTRSGSGRPASASATATRPRSPPTTGTAASGAPTRKPPTTAPRRCGSPTTCAARPCCCWPGPTPKPPSCPGGCRPGSSRWARVGPPQAALSDGNHAGVGDLVRARLNTEIDAGGRKLTNRDTLKITALRRPDAEVRRQRPDGTWTEPFRVPRSYLAHNAELGYGGNVHVAQGRTVDTAHLLVTDSLSRQALYVGMTRGREANTAHVVTGKTAPSGQKPYQQAAPESVLAGVLQRAAEDLSATEQIRQAQEWAGGTGHLLHLWSAATRQACTRTSMSVSRLGSPRPRDGGTTGSTRGRCCSTRCGMPSSPGTTSAR